MSYTTERLCDLGQCSTRYENIDGFKFENKVYPKEDAKFISQETFKMTQILNHTLLEGESSTGGDIYQDFVQVMDGVKPGERKRIVRIEIKAKGWTSEVNGRCATDCGFWPQRMINDKQIDKDMCTKAVGQDYKFCVKKLRNSWRSNLLPLGQNREAEDIPVPIMDELLYATIKNNLILIDKHAWAGDYKSVNEDVMHLDGFIKLAVLALEEEKPFVIQYILTGIEAGESVWYKLGGLEVEIPANADEASTVNDIVVSLQNDSYVDENDNPLLPSVVDDGPVTEAGGAFADGHAFTVTYPKGVDVISPLQLVVADSQGVKECFTEGAPSVLKPINAKFDSENCVEAMVLQVAQGSSTKPIAIKKLKVNKHNVVNRIVALYEAIQDEKPELLTNDFDGYLFVAGNIFDAISIAVKEENTAFVTSCGAVEVCEQLYFPRIVKMNYLPRDEMFFASAEDLYMGTDLLGDANEITNIYDPSSDCIELKNRFALGFQLGDTGRIAGTFCGRENEFGPEMPCENQNC